MRKLDPSEAKDRGLPEAKGLIRDVLVGQQQEQLGLEIDRAREFGRAHIEKKHGMPFDEWVRNRKQKKEKGE